MLTIYRVLTGFFRIANAGSAIRLRAAAGTIRAPRLFAAPRYRPRCRRVRAGSPRCAGRRRAAVRMSAAWRSPAGSGLLTVRGTSGFVVSAKMPACWACSSSTTSASAADRRRRECRCRQKRLPTRHRSWPQIPASAPAPARARACGARSRSVKRGSAARSGRPMDRCRRLGHSRSSRTSRSCSQRSSRVR